MTEDGERLAASTTLVRRGESMSSELEDERVILELQSGTYYGVNSVGTRIWELLAEPRTVSELQAHVADEFQTSVEECGADVKSFCADLLEAELVEIPE